MGTLTRVMADATLPLYDLYCAVHGDTDASHGRRHAPSLRLVLRRTRRCPRRTRRYYDRLRHLRTEEKKGKGPSPADVLFAELGNAPNMTVAQRQECRRQVEADVDAAQISQFFRAHESPIDEPS